MSSPPVDVLPSREVLASEIEDLSVKLESAHDALREAGITDIMLKRDDIGWRDLGGAPLSANGPKLEDVVRLIDDHATLINANPLVGRALNLRVSYVWGDGITLKADKTLSDAKKKKMEKFVKANAAEFFSADGAWRLEADEAATGNVITLVLGTGATAELIPIPLREIKNYLTAPNDPSKVIFILRGWTVNAVEDGEIKSVVRQKWYAVDDFDVRKHMPERTGFPTQLPDGSKELVEVEQRGRVVIKRAHAHRGWRWGTPTLMSSKWWVAAYKQYLEMGQALTKALARFAFRSTNNSQAAANRTAMAYNKDSGLGTPARGDVPAVGGLAAGWGNDKLEAINKSGTGFDFASGTPIAEMMAAGFEMPVDLLLARQKPEGDQTALDEASVKEKLQAQRSWDDYLTRIFELAGFTDIDIRFVPVRTVPVHRAMQALAVIASTGVLFPKEVRDQASLLLKEYGADIDAEKLPKAGEWVEFSKPPAHGDAGGGDPAHPGTKPLNTPDAGDDKSRSPAGALDDGDNDAAKN